VKLRFFSVLVKAVRLIPTTSMLYFHASVFGENLPTVVISDGLAHVTTPSGKKQLVHVHQATSEPGAKFLDLTFDGYADLLFLRDRGASQEFYDVFLYSKKQDAYIYNKTLSQIPCLAVDIRRKELVGQCFHESACENWEEYYSVSPKGRISLTERKGTYCDPTSGQGYTYSDQFRNGRKISSKILPLSQ
jgi:hypothetical protein